jgi:hypothetical protein
MLNDFLTLPIKRTIIYREKSYPDTPHAVGPDTASPDLLT